MENKNIYHYKNHKTFITMSHMIDFVLEHNVHCKMNLISSQREIENHK